MIQRRKLKPRKPLTTEKLRGLLGGAYFCACLASLALVVSLIESQYGRGSKENLFVGGMYAAAYTIAGFIASNRLADAFIESTDHLGNWARRLAVVAAAIAWQLAAFVLLIVATNIVEILRGVFEPDLPWATNSLGFPIVILTGLEVWIFKRALLRRLSRPRKIFVNYRREDSSANAARVADRLAFAMGRKRVFMDIDNLSAGQRFDRELEMALAQCTVFIAVIGPRWMDLLQQRIQGGERDYVREEIAGALKNGLLVVPVLMEGAALPRPDLLPPDIRDLVFHQKHSVAHERFGRDIDDLIAAIKTNANSRLRPQTAR